MDIRCPPHTTTNLPSCASLHNSLHLWLGLGFCSLVVLALAFSCVASQLLLHAHAMFLSSRGLSNSMWQRMQRFDVIIFFSEFSTLYPCFSSSNLP
jgi:hypothetical protein